MPHSFFYNLPETMKTDIKILPQVKLKKMSVDFYKTFFFPCIINKIAKIAIIFVVSCNAACYEQGPVKPPPVCKGTAWPLIGIYHMVLYWLVVLDKLQLPILTK